MSVKQVIEQGHLRSGTIDTASFGSSVRVFLVYCDSMEDDDTVALFAEDDDGNIIPSIRSAHPSRIGIYCSELAARSVAEFCWEVSCTYAHISGEKYPWNRAATFSGSFKQFKLPIDKLKTSDGEGGDEDDDTEHDDEVDSSSTLIRNSAGDPFDPAPERDASFPVISFTKNVQHFSGVQAWMNLQDKVNDSTWFGWDERRCKVDGMTWSQASEVIDGEETGYFVVNGQITINTEPEGWKLVLLDAGYRELNLGTSPTSIVNIAINGREPAQPVPLNGHGKVPRDEDGNIDVTADPVWLWWNVNETADFSIFGLSTP